MVARIVAEAYQKQRRRVRGRGSKLAVLGGTKGGTKRRGIMFLTNPRRGAARSGLEVASNAMKTDVAAATRVNRSRFSSTLLYGAIWLLGLVVVQVGTATRAAANSFYIDSSGSDTNSGRSPSSPWKTLARINSTALGPGDTVYLKRGSLWRETLIVNGSGAAGAPITITAYGVGALPAISGANVVTGWAAYSNSVYATPLREKPSNVYLDNEPGWGMNQAGSQSSMSPDSWYWDGSKLFVNLADGSDPSRHTIEAAVRDKAVSADNRSYIVIDSLRTLRTGCWAISMISQNASRNVGSKITDNVITQNGTNLLDTGRYCNAIYINYATSPTVEGNTVSYAGGHNAINVQKATDIRILNNDVSEWNHNGLDTKMSQGIVYMGNRAHDAPHGNGIYSEQSADITAENNTIYNIGGSTNGNSNGVHFEPCKGRIVISGNSISNTYGGIYLRSQAIVDNNSVNTRSGESISRRLP